MTVADSAYSFAVANGFNAVCGEVIGLVIFDFLISRDFHSEFVPRVLSC